MVLETRFACTSIAKLAGFCAGNVSMRVLQYKVWPRHALMQPLPGILSTMLAILFGVLAALCWSVTDLLARMMAAAVGAFRMSALVMLLGSVSLGIYVIPEGAIWHISGEQLMWGLLLGVAYGFGIAGLFKAFSLGPVSLVAPITAGYPVLTVLWGVINGLVPTPLQWGCVAATLIGAIIVARSGTEDGGVNAVAPGKMPLLLLFAALSVAGYSSAVVLSQHAGQVMGEIQAAWLSRVASLVTLLPFLMTEKNTSRLSRWHWTGLLVIGALDVLGLIIISATGHLPGREFAGIGISAYGAMSVLLAMIFLKEKVSAGQWLGLAMIVAAVATISLSQPV